MKKVKPKIEEEKEVTANEAVAEAVEPGVAEAVEPEEVSKQTPEVAQENLGLKEKILERIQGGK